LLIRKIPAEGVAVEGGEATAALGDGLLLVAEAEGNVGNVALLGSVVGDSDIL